MVEIASGGAESKAAKSKVETRLVWDLPLRAFHWLLALSILGLWVTAKVDIPFWQSLWIPLHHWLGYFVIGLVLFRVIWGFVGPKHARFTSFVPGPKKILGYLSGKLHTVGHNPLGAFSVIALLIVVLVQAVSGLFSADDIEFPVNAGPWFDSVSAATAGTLTRIHRTNINLLLALVALHLLAVAFYAVVKRQNLVVPMITGRKAASLVPEGEAIAGSRLVVAAVVIVIAAVAVWAFINAAPPPAPVDDFS